MTSARTSTEQVSEKQNRKKQRGTYTAVTESVRMSE